MNQRTSGWFRLLLGIGVVVAFVVVLHLGSLHLGGSPGRFIEENREKDLEVYAYVYSDVGPLEDFLDDEFGRYGRCSLKNALDDQR